MEVEVLELIRLIRVSDVVVMANYKSADSYKERMLDLVDVAKAANKLPADFDRDEFGKIIKHLSEQSVEGRQTSFKKTIQKSQNLTPEVQKAIG